MTFEEALKEAEKLLKNCKKALKNDARITIAGNDYNCSEAYGGIKYLVELFRKVEK